MSGKGEQNGKTENRNESECFSLKGMKNHRGGNLNKMNENTLYTHYWILNSKYRIMYVNMSIYDSFVSLEYNLHSPWNIKVKTTTQ